MKLPYGYFIDGDGKISINDAQASNVKLIFQNYLSGDSFSKIAATLADNKITSPSGKGDWSCGTIDRILSNKKYITHIISMEQFFEVQFEKATRSSVDHDTGKRKATRYNSQNVLSGLLICAECGASYRRITPASGNVVWRCASRVEHGKNICQGSPSVLESEIIPYICKLLDIDEFELQAVKTHLETISIGSDASMNPEFVEQLMPMQF